MISDTNGFCECKKDWVAQADGTCLSPCYVGGDDAEVSIGDDECYPDIGTDITAKTEAALWTDTNGCITTLTTDTNWDTSSYYCKCDSENGWDVSATAGDCTPVCYKAGKQSDTDSPVNSDECWPGADVADLTALTTAVGAGCILTTANVATPSDTNGGFCKCDLATGYVKEYSSYAVGTAPAYTGTGEVYNIVSGENAPCLPAAYAPGLNF